MPEHKAEGHSPHEIKEFLLPLLLHALVDVIADELICGITSFKLTHVFVGEACCREAQHSSVALAWA